MDSIAIHPAAELLPKLDDEELGSLADDIRVHGQHDPFVVLVDADGAELLLDGRNRLAACRLAGVKPTIRQVTVADIGGDPAAYVIGTNIHRRHLIAAQRAAALALLKPEPKMGRGSSDKQSRKYWGVSSEYLRQARAVLRADRELLLRVLRNELPLGVAFNSLGEKKNGHDAAPATKSPPIETAIPRDPRPTGRPTSAPIERSQPAEPKQQGKAPQRATTTRTRCTKCGRTVIEERSAGSV